MSLPLSHIRRIGDTIYFAGQGAVGPDGAFLSDTFEGQFRATLEKLRALLTEAGVGFEDVVSVRSYVQNPSDLKLYNQLYREYFVEPYPVRTTIVNCLPPGLLFEIDCIAAAKP